MTSKTSRPRGVSIINVLCLLLIGINNHTEEYKEAVIKPQFIIHVCSSVVESKSRLVRSRSTQFYRLSALTSNLKEKAIINNMFKLAKIVTLSSWKSKYCVDGEPCHLHETVHLTNKELPLPTNGSSPSGIMVRIREIVPNCIDPDDQGC